MNDDRFSFDSFPDEDKPEIYYGPNPTETERISGEEVFAERQPYRPLKPGSVGHQALAGLASMGPGRWTAYEVSRKLCADPHGMRRELRRLYDRGFVTKDGTKTNVGVTVRGREHVDAYRMLTVGQNELHRLNGSDTGV